MAENYKNQDFDIIIQAGQSNSQGCGVGPSARSYGGNPDVLYLNNELSIYVADEESNGFELTNNFSLSFCDRYIKDGRLASGRKLLVLRAAIGGTGFLDDRWKLTDDLYLKMMEMIETALSIGGDNRLVALLWHQGETDATLNATYDTHYKNLSTLLNSVRERFNCPNLPFIAGDFVKEWKDKNIEICIPVVKAMIDLCAGHNCGFVTTEEFRSNNQVTGNADDIHFCREDMNVLGEKYYDAFCEAVQ